MKDIHTEVKTDITHTKDRAQKIVAALYLLTNHIDIENPLRLEIRTAATQMLKAVLLGSKIDDIKNTILSFLSVAVLTKEVSPENASIIEAELSTLKVHHMQVSEPVLSHIFMNEKDHALVEAKETAKVQEVSSLKSLEIRQHISGPDVREVNASKETSSFQKPKLSDISTQASRGQVIDNNVPNKKDEKKARRGRVLEYLSKTELRSIKDISKFFTDCSEKTIQRELNDLVDDKIIIRVGDRRWSTYKLA